MIIVPEANESCVDFLKRRGEGRAMFLLKAKIDGTITSVCENTQQNGAWRTKDGKEHQGHLRDDPRIDILPDTLSLTCKDATEIAEALPVVSDALVRHCGRSIPLGKISRGDSVMPKVLAAMESVVDDIRSSLNKDLTTDLFQIRRSLRKSSPLIVGGQMSPHGIELLRAFTSSHGFYAVLPELREFVGLKRKDGDPSDKGGKIRRWIQRTQFLNLSTGERLDYVEYELKPLRVSNILKWTCPVAEDDTANPRRDSLDLLMRLDRSPVFVEIKASNDSFCSSALAQILYYGCILTANRQRNRLTRQFPAIANVPGWLCVIAQERDERKEPGFTADEQQTIQFLRHPETKKALAPHFKGGFIVVINVTSDGELSVTRSATVLFDTPN